jgi:cobalamin biosynthesis protein CobD/CbiB
MQTLINLCVDNTLIFLFIILTEIFLVYLLFSLKSLHDKVERLERMHDNVEKLF